MIGLSEMPEAFVLETRNEFWIEEVTGAIWAVELRDGDLAGCYGPLLLDEVDEDLLECFEYSRGGVAWIEQHRDRFSHYVPVVPFIPPS
jgi:hypothetical protein